MPGGHPEIPPIHLPPGCEMKINRTAACTLIPTERAWNPAFCLWNTQSGCCGWFRILSKWVSESAKIHPISDVVKKIAGLQSIRNIYNEKQKSFKLGKLGALILKSSYLFILPFGEAVLFFSSVWKEQSCEKEQGLQSQADPTINPCFALLFYSHTIFRKFYLLITPWIY